MYQSLRQILLSLAFIVLLLPAVCCAGSLESGATTDTSDQSVNDASSGTIPVLPQVPEIKFHEAGAPPEEGAAGPTGGHKERINVVYDLDTEKERGKMIALVVAFGISLALNIYLATALFSARRR